MFKVHYLKSKLYFISCQHNNITIQRKNCFRLYFIVWEEPITSEI